VLPTDSRCEVSTEAQLDVKNLGFDSYKKNGFPNHWKLRLPKGTTLLQDSRQKNSGKNRGSVEKEVSKEMASGPSRVSLD